MKLHYMCLGKGMTKQENSFSDKGAWNLLKCFYEDKGRYGEFYFNFNTETGEAEIICKDEMYSSILLTGLVKEFCSKREIVENEKGNKKLIDWNAFTDVLLKCEENSDKTISRHAKGLLKALKL